MQWKTDYQDPCFREIKQVNKPIPSYTIVPRLYIHNMIKSSHEAMVPRTALLETLLCYRFGNRF